MKSRSSSPLLMLLFVAILVAGCGSEGICPDTNCEDYFSQSAAQADFNADPECYGDLDHDNDGIACEHFSTYYSSGSGGGSGGGFGCPTTANCGCSNKTKSVCEADPCCQWIVGQGCKCA